MSDDASWAGPAGALREAARERRRALERERPAITILCGPASAEDQAYYARTPPERLSTVDLHRTLSSVCGTPVTVIDITRSPRWFDAIGDRDLVVVNLHGSPGEDGTIQGLLRSRAIRFVGSDVEASVLALNKGATKLLAVAMDVPTPAFSIVADCARVTCASPSPGSLRICKPLRGGSSLHTRLVVADEPLPGQGDWLIEDYLEGSDVTVAIVEVAGRPTALPAIVLEHGASFYDVDRKLVTDPADKAMARRPPAMRDALDRCERLAVRMHAALGAAHISRSDFVVHRGEPYFLELNTLPGLSATSNVADGAAMAGLAYADLLALVVGAALAR